MIKQNKHKLLTSNFTVEEQNSFILKDLQKEENFENKFSFLNKNLTGVKNNFIGFYKYSDEQFQKINMPDIILSAYFLKEIFNLLKENKLNRRFFINILNENELEINDILFNKKKTIKNDIFLKKSDSFIINSEIFYLFKLNQKTINKKSFIYIFKDLFIYENNRNKESFFYTLKQGDYNE